MTTALPTSEDKLTWKQRNRQYLRYQAREYYARNRDRCKANTKAYQEAHPEKRRVYSATYYAKHKARCLAATKRWITKHPEIRRTYKEMRGRSPALREEAAKIAAWETNWRKEPTVMCVWCYGSFHPSKCHKDHIVALSIGGEHQLDNLVISCGACNQRKADKPMVKWMRELMFQREVQ
jgi:5-methylcytosine-specific restriction endonuclease McrA